MASTKRMTFILEGLTQKTKIPFQKALSASPDLKVVSIDVPRSVVVVESKMDSAVLVKMAAEIAGITVRRNI